MKSPKTTVSEQNAWRLGTAFLGRFLAALLLLTLLLEGLARTPWLEAVAPYRSLGMWYYPFDIKWQRLQRYVEQNGGVDVIILGSSLVNTGFVPEVVSRAYQVQTGQTLRVFNFGVEGMTIAPNSVTARLLVEQFQPGLLIFVTEIRDYDPNNGLAVQESFLSSAWVRYRTGKPDPSGWAIDHSLALQRYLVYRNWLSYPFAGSMRTYFEKLENTSTAGYEPDYGVMKWRLPGRAPPTQNLILAESRLENLRSILSLTHDHPTQILIFEMPVDQRVYQPYGGAQARQKFQTTLAQVVQTGGGLFLPADAVWLPAAGRSNEVHINFQGAPLLSAYLGAQLARLNQQQDLSFSSR